MMSLGEYFLDEHSEEMWELFIDILECLRLDAHYEQMMKLVVQFLKHCDEGMAAVYEYQFYNGELDIDQIAGKQKRRRVFSIRLRDIDIMAQTGTGILKEYHDLKKYDCTSNQGNITYTIILDHYGNKIQLLIEPNEELLLNMKYYEQRKVLVM